jgi:hypothetical protein
VFLKTRREWVHVVHVLARPYPFLQGRLVRKPDRLEQAERHRVYNVLVHHPMMRVVHEPRMVAIVIKLDRWADRGDGHAPRVGGVGLGHVYRRRARAACRRDNGCRYCLHLRVAMSVSTPAVRSPHVALPRCAPRPKQTPQRLLFLPLSLVPKRPVRRDDGRGTDSGSPMSISERCWRYRRSGSSAGRFARTCR